MARFTVSDINLAWLESATLEDLKSAMRSGGDVLAAVNALLVSPEGKKIAGEMLNDPDYVPTARRQPDPEEAAQIAEDEARAAAQAEEDRVAAAAALQPVPDGTVPPETTVVVTNEANVARAIEDEAAKKYGLTIVRTAKGDIEKVIHEYQATDEDGRPIGRPTHFESTGLIEAIGKIQNAHVNAARYADRVKNNRFKQSASALNSAERSAAAQTALAESDRLAEEAAAEKDPIKMKEAVKRSVAAQREAEQADVATREHGRIVAQSWMDDHKEDFLPCLASSNIMREYMVANTLTMTYDNLEKAFEAVKTQLPKVERQPATESASVAPVVNPPAAASATPATTPVAIPPAAVVATEVKPTVQPKVEETPTPTAEAPASTPAAAPNAQPAARKPGVNGGLQPGSMSAQRPVVLQATPAETRSKLMRDIGKMSPAEFRKKLRDDNYVKQLDAAGIKYR
jgi:hypothetical protein